MTAKERIKATLDSLKFENRVHEIHKNLNELDPTGSIELSLRLEDIGMPHIDAFMELSLDEQVSVLRAAMEKHLRDTDLHRRLEACLDFIVPAPPVESDEHTGRCIHHYQTVTETEKAICVSLDGSDECSCWIPKSAIRGKTRRRSTHDPEAMKTPIATWWAKKNEQSGGPIF